MKLNLFFKAILIAIVGFSFSFICFRLSGNFLEANSTIKSLVKTYFPFASGSYHVINKSLSASDINSIEVISETTNVDFQSVDSSNISLQLITNSDSSQVMNIENNSHTLQIDLVHLEKNSDCSLTVKVPKNIKTIKVANGTGDTSFSKMTVENVIVNTVSGDIDLEDVKINNAKLSAISGDISLEGMSIKTEMNSISGDIKLESSLLIPFYNIKTVSGDVNLILTKSVNAKLDIQSLSGHVTTTHSIQIVHHAKGVGEIKVRSVSGDIEVSSE